MAEFGRGAGYQRRRLWGITEEAVEAFDALVDAAMSSGGGDQSCQRRRLTLVLDGLVGAGDGGGRALIQASPMRSGFPTAAAARAWIVDLLAAAARQQAERWWQGWDDDGDPAIHGMPFKRLRNRTGLARWVLDRRVQVRLSQQVVADACGVVQGEVQAWEAGARIPTSAELDALARVLDLDRGALADAETGGLPQRAERRPAGRARRPLLGERRQGAGSGGALRSPGPLPPQTCHRGARGVECENCGAEMVFTARDRRRIQFAGCPSCGRARYFGRDGSVPVGAGFDESAIEGAIAP